MIIAAVIACGIVAVVVTLALGSYSPVTQVDTSNNATSPHPISQPPLPPLDSNETSNIPVVKTSDMPEQDISEKVNAADRTCGPKLCEIRITDTSLQTKGNRASITTPISLSDNRILSFPSGHFLVSAQIALGNNNEVRGQGMNNTIFIRDPSWFAGKGSDKSTDPPGDVNQIDDADMFKAVDRDSVILHDFAINGSTNDIGFIPIEGKTPIPTGKIFHYPKGRQNEVNLDSASNVHLYNLTISDVQRFAINAKGTENATIESCDISSNGYNRDVLIYTGTPSRIATNLQILDNHIHDGSHAGLYLENVNGSTVQGNVFDHNRANTYFTGSGGQINILPSSHNIKISNNTIINAGYVPVSETPRRVTPVVGYGIEVHGFDIEIANNTIQNNAGPGIFIMDNTMLNAPPTHDVIIQGNKYDNNGFGIGNQHVDVRVYNGAENIKVLDTKPDIVGAYLPPQQQ